MSEILSRWQGESEQRLRGTFAEARRRAPAVVFIDEVDNIVGSRSETGEALVNVLLEEMDGRSAANENIMVLSATNVPWRIDHTLRRTGRFERVIFVPPPDAATR